MSDMETAHQIRGIAARAYIHAVNDNGESQTANVTVYQGVDRSDVEILQQYGFTSRAPKGGLMLVFAVGGDQGDLVGIAAGAPHARLGNLEDGESAHYGPFGARVHIKQDGTIEAWSPTRVISKVKNAEFEVTEDMIRGLLKDSGSRLVARPDYAKIRFGGHWIVVNAGGIFCSVPPVLGPDPEPEI